MRFFVARFDSGGGTGRVLLVLGGMVVATLLGGRTASAESLQQALAATYLSNPTLQAERAKLRAVDEELPRARSGFRPRIIGDADVGVQRTKTDPDAATDGTIHPKGYGVTLTQPLFRGFRTVNATRQADATILAAREDLRRVEQDVLLEAATAYMDVVRDMAIVRLRRNNVRVLAEQLAATRNRFDVGEVTRTDVAQAEARWSRARSLVNLAVANLKNSRANFERVVGHSPSRLSYPSGLERYLPRTLNEALKRGEAESPVIWAAIYREKAARHAVDVVRGEALPEVTLEASYQRRFEPSKFVDRQETGIIKGKVTIPFYLAGDVSARVRQAKETLSQRRLELAQARKSTRANIIASWGRLVSIKAQIASDRAQVKAARTALQGVREEEKVGQRTVLDVLNAEQELLDAKVALLGSRRDYVVAAFSLMAATGRLSAADLALPVVPYDPTEHYEEVKHKWVGFGVRDNGYYEHDAYRKRYGLK